MKKKFDKLESYEQQLWELAQDKNMDKETFDKIFKIIVDSGLYSFNKSHAVAYAILCYVTAYYKVYYPKEYLCAEFTNIYNSVAADKRKERVTETVKECRRLGIKFLPVKADKSEWKLTIEDDKIRIGMCAISSFGYKAYQALEQLEDRSSLEVIYNNVNKTVCNKKAFNALIFSGAFGNTLDSYYEYCKLRNEEPSETIVFHKNLKFSIYDDDKEMEEGLLSCNFIHSLTNNFESFDYENIKNKSIFSCKGIITRVTKKKDKNKNMMAWATIETGAGALEAVVFANTYAKIKSSLKKNALISLKGKKEDGYKCTIIDIT